MLATLRLSLSDEELVRADRFLFERDRNLYTAAHALLHALLVPVGAPAARFRENKWGKPEIDAQGDMLRFNLTHTRGLVACAMTMVDDLGVDAESSDRRVDFVALARKFFAPSEAEYVSSLPQVDQGPAFLRLWTLKEAFIKAVGKGLSTALAKFSFTLEPFSFRCAPSLRQVAEDWQFQSFTLGSTHYLALALHRPAALPMVLKHRIIAPEALASRGEDPQEFEALDS